MPINSRALTRITLNPVGLGRLTNYPTALISSFALYCVSFGVLDILTGSRCQSPASYADECRSDRVDPLLSALSRRSDRQRGQLYLRVVQQYLPGDRRDCRFSSLSRSVH